MRCGSNIKSLADATLTLAPPKLPLLRSIVCFHMLNLKVTGFRGMKRVPINFSEKKKKKKWMANPKGSKEQPRSSSEKFREAHQGGLMCPDELSELGSGGCLLRQSQTQSAPAWNLGRAKGFVFPLLLLRSISFSTWLLCCRLHALAARRSSLSSGKISGFFPVIIIVVILTRQSCQLWE